MKKRLWFMVPFIFCVLLMGCGGSTPNDQNEPDNPPTIVLSAQEQDVLNQINQYRNSKGLRPLTINDRLTEQARNHSREMAIGQVPFGHDGFEARIQATGLQGPAAENVASNYGDADPVTVAVEGWIASVGHRMNIEGNYNLTGIGVVRNSNEEYYFTQIFMLVNP